MTSGATDCTLTASQSGSTSWNAATSVVRTVAAQRRPVTVTADAKSKVYGATDPTLTYTAGALVGSDSFTGSLARVSGDQRRHLRHRAGHAERRQPTTTSASPVRT